MTDDRDSVAESRMTGDRRSRLSNAAAAVWPTPDSRKVEARMMRKALKKYCIKFTVTIAKNCTDFQTSKT